MKETKQTQYTTKKIGIVPIFVRTLCAPKSCKAMFKYLVTVMRDFFFLQFAVKFGFKKIPVLNVDHPLDKTVPFTPEKVSVYLGFVAFWIRPLGYIGRRYGRKAQVEYTARFLALVDRCYRDAAEVYRFRMTTTKRPHYHKGRFFTIHLFDPHYLCVPSLHIIIVVLAYTFYREAFKELGMGEEEAAALNKEMFEGAIDIAETVLYIKQHSVNCIPAALYAMTRITPDTVTPTEVMNFIDHLFVNAPTVGEENAAKIRTHIADMYEVLFLEGCHDNTWIAPLQRWLNNYTLAGFVNEN
jgi:hypothetical protein